MNVGVGDVFLFVDDLVMVVVVLLCVGEIVSGGGVLDVFVLLFVEVCFGLDVICGKARDECVCVCGFIVVYEEEWCVVEIFYGVAVVRADGVFEVIGVWFLGVFGEDEVVRDRGCVVCEVGIV